MSGLGCSSTLVGTKLEVPYILGKLVKAHMHGL